MQLFNFPRKTEYLWQFYIEIIFQEKQKSFLLLQILFHILLHNKSSLKLFHNINRIIMSINNDQFQVIYYPSTSISMLEHFIYHTDIIKNKMKLCQ